MRTMLDVINAVKRKLILNDDTYDEDIRDCIQQVIRARNQDRYWFLERLGTLTLPLDSGSVSFPDDYGDIEKISIIQNNTIHDMGIIPFTQLQSRYYNKSPIEKGLPHAIAKSNRTIYFSHIANQEYTLSVTYFVKDATTPEADSDTSVWFGDDGFDLVRAQATYLMRLTVMEEDANTNEVDITTSVLREKHRKFRTY